MIGLILYIAKIELIEKTMKNGLLGNIIGSLMKSINKL
jgi:hypothetical protein